MIVVQNVFVTHCKLFITSSLYLCCSLILGALEGELLLFHIYSETSESGESVFSQQYYYGPLLGFGLPGYVML